MAPCCDGPVMGDGMVAGPVLPVPPPAAPPLAPLPGPPPRILTEPAQPTPALPSSRIK